MATIFKGSEELPLPVRQALINSGKDYGENVSNYLRGVSGRYNHAFSVTTVGGLVKAYWLTRKNDVVVDPIDLFSSMLGTLFHKAMEDATPEHWIKEKRMHKIIKIHLNGKVSRCLFHGQIDAYDPDSETLMDYKLSSPFAFMNESKEYEFQLNAGRLLLESNGFRVTRLVNIYAFKSLDARMANAPGYPDKQIMEKEIPIWTKKKTLRIIKKKLRALLEGENNLPKCSASDRWVRGTAYKVYFHKKAKGGGFSSRAAFTCSTYSEAAQKASGQPNSKIAKIPGKSTRCEYCNAALLCGQRKAELKRLTNQFVNK